MGRLLAAQVAETNRTRALETWNSMLTFLDQPTVADYGTIASALANEAPAPTTPVSQCDGMTNADEVRNALAGTRFAMLLRC